jgi:serine/threonine protein kinase
MQVDLRCPTPQKLQDFALGILPKEDALWLQRHVIDCPRCRAAIEELGGKAALEETLGPPNRQAARHETPTQEDKASKRSDYAFLSPPAGPGEIGRLGDYCVIRLLGEGGMGLVFLAEDIHLGRPVALKVMKPALQSDAEGWQRFVREARMMAAVKHDNLVTVYQAGQAGEVFYFAMELLEGESLGDWLKRHPRADPAEVVRLGREIARGLAAIHQHHLVHRDLKPANIWLEGRQRRVKILDLGIVRHTKDELTLTGTVLGTPGYMSPEQARGDPVDARSDLFSLGCVLYTLATGTRPFTGNSSMAVLTALAVDKPTPVHERNPQVPEPLSDLIMQLLAKRADMRPQSADEVLDRLGRMADTAVDSILEQTSPEERTGETILDTGRRRGRQTERRRRISSSDLVLGAIAVAGLAALAVVVLAAVWFLRPAPPVDAHPVTYLTELKEVARENWPFRPPQGGRKDKGPKGPKQGPKPGPPPGGPPPGGPPPAPGSEVRVHGVVAAHGIFMHPPGDDQEGQPASLSYSLGKAYQVFQTDVSFNDGPQRSELPCTFFVYGDGRLLWKSRPVSSQADAQPCLVSVEGVDILRIVVVCPGPPHGAHAVWIDPRVIK